MKRILTVVALALFLPVILLAACGGATPAPTGQPVSGPPTPGTPQPGKSTVTGRALALDTGHPLTNTVVRLAEVLHLPPDADTFMLNDATSPGAYSDDQGYFVIANVDPKDFVIIIGDINMSYAIATAEPDKAKVWKLTAGQVTDVGDLRVVMK